MSVAADAAPGEDPEEGDSEWVEVVRYRAPRRSLYDKTLGAHKGFAAAKRGGVDRPASMTDVKSCAQR